MNGKSKIWAIALLSGVLVLGGVAGAAVDRSLLESPSCPDAERDRRSHEDRHEGYLDWLSAELSLTPAQRAEVEGHVERHRASVKELWREMRPRFEEMKAALRDDIRGVLTEEQLAAYEALLAKSQEERKRRR